MAELKTCVRCGAEKPTSEFYRRGKGLCPYCKPCFNAQQLASRRKPGRRDKVSAANNVWLKKHPEVNRKAQARARAKRREQNPLWQPPASHLLMGEAVQRSGYTRQYISMAIDRSQLEAYRDHGKFVISRASFTVWLAGRGREASDE